MKIKYILLASLSIANFTNGRIPDKRDLRGLYDAVLDNKKYLSPYNGFIWIESESLLLNYYKYGYANIEKDKEGVVKQVKKQGTDPTMYLLLSFFHEVDKQISATKVPGKPGTYLTPKIIGQLMVDIEKLEGLEEKNQLIRKTQQNMAASMLSAIE